MTLRKTKLQVCQENSRPNIKVGMWKCFSSVICFISTSLDIQPDKISRHPSTSDGEFRHFIKTYSMDKTVGQVSAFKQKKSKLVLGGARWKTYYKITKNAATRFFSSSDFNFFLLKIIFFSFYKCMYTNVISLFLENSGGLFFFLRII